MTAREYPPELVEAVVRALVLADGFRDWDDTPEWLQDHAMLIAAPAVLAAVEDALPKERADAIAVGRDLKPVERATFPWRVIEP